MTVYPEDRRLQSHLAASPSLNYAEFLSCPECGHQIPLTTEDMDWAVTGPRDVADRLLARYSHMESEHLIVLSLTTKNRVMDETVVYIGNVNTTLVRVGELFTTPIRHHAAGMLLVHTHPSGDPSPSPDDLYLTSEVLAAAKLLDLRFLDHVILGNGQYVSLRDRGIDFGR